MILYKYENYQEYVDVQIEANKKKIGRVWANSDIIEDLSQEIKSCVGQPEFGLCHGTRRGIEQKLFSEYLNCPVLGTEISDTATQFPNTIQWDFHEVKEEWIGNCDFIYTNSFDHAFDPELALSSWLKCLSEKGILLIEYIYFTPDRCLEAKRTDPFHATVEELELLFENCGARLLRKLNFQHPEPEKVVVFILRNAK